MSGICGYEVGLGPYILRANSRPNCIYVLNSDDTTTSFFNFDTAVITQDIFQTGVTSIRWQK